MKLSPHDAALLTDLRTQSKLLIALYLGVGVVGLIVTLFLEMPVPLRAIAAFLSGGLVGITVEKLVSRRIRQLAFQLWQHRASTNP